MTSDEKTGAATPFARRATTCRDAGHLWGDPYSFGGVAWYRDCLRCFEGEEIRAAARPESGVFALHGKVTPLDRTGSGD
jgi:hypothetical protein